MLDQHACHAAREQCGRVGPRKRRRIVHRVPILHLHRAWNKHRNCAIGDAGNAFDPGACSRGVQSDGIVLRVTENGAILWQATALLRGEQDAAMFGVPAGYQIIDPAAVAESVGENMQPLDSVTGAPATAAPPAPPR